MQSSFFSFIVRTLGVIFVIEAIFFDMDGLMLDTEPITIQAKVIEGNKIGLPITEAMVRDTIGMSQKNVDQYYHHLFGDKYYHQYFIEKRREYLFHYMEEHGLPLKKGLIPLLELLKSKHLPLAVVTSSTKEILAQYQKYGTVFEYFDRLITGDEVKEGKPNPDVYLYAAKVMGVDPKNCVVLEDSKNGIISASKAGMQVLMIPDLIMPDEEVLSYHPKIYSSLEAAMEYFQDNEIA